MLTLRTGETKTAGFSLTEVLIAFAILSVTLVVIYQAIGASMRQTIVIEERQEALYVAQSIIARIGLDIPLEPGEQSNVAGRFAWRLEIAPYANSDEDENAETVLYLVTVRVYPEQRSEIERAHLATLRLATQ